VAYEDDDNLQLEFPLVQKFSKAQVSPPIVVDDLPKTEQTLQKLRDALKIKGKVEIAQNKAKLLKDETWTQGEEFENLQKSLNEFDEETQKRLDAIKRDKVNWTDNADETGINVDEELDEEEIGQRFTKLRPERGPDRRRDRFDNRDGNQRDNRRGRSQGPRQARRDFDNFEDEKPREKPAPRQPQKKFNGGAMEDFPEF